MDADGTELDRRGDDTTLDGTDVEPGVDWRNRVGTIGLLVGSAMVALDKVLFPEKRKADTEQVTGEPLGSWPRLEFGNAGLDQLGPDEDGYWPG